MKTFLEDTREERIAGARALGRVISAGDRLKQAGISLDTVAKLSTVGPGEFTQLCASMTLEQSTLLRDYFKSLLDLAVIDKVGEVVLSSVNTNTIRAVIKDSGLVSFLHDLVDIDISVKKFEANAAAKSGNGKPALAENLRKFKEQVEHCVGEVAGSFVA